MPPVESLDGLLKQSAWINRLARALIQDAAEREDIVQELWLAALKRPPGAGRERAWSRSVLKRRFADRLRRREPVVALDPDRALDAELDPGAVASTLENHARLGRAVAALPERARSLVVARYFHGREPKEMAAALGVEESTLRSQLSRALAALRRDLEADTPEDSRAWVVGLLPLATRGLKTAPITKTFLGSLQVMGVIMGYKSLGATAAVVLGLCVWVGSHYLDDAASRLAAQEEALTGEVTNANPGRATRELGDASSAKSTESEPGDVVVASSRQCTIEVRDHEGQLQPSARVVLHRGGEILLDGKTDARGELRVESRLGSLETVVIAEGHALFLTEVDTHEDCRLSLPELATMSGRVRVAGGLPYRPLVLHIKQDDPALDALPEAVRRHIWYRYYEDGITPLPVASDGQFLMHGLRADAPVSVFLPAGFAHILDHDRYWPSSRDFPRPEEGMLIDLMAMPRLRARLVDATTGEPLPGRLCGVTLRTADNRGESRMKHPSDEDGRVEIGFGFVEFETIKLHTRIGGELLVLHEGGYFRDTLDLGDIPVQVPQSWHLRVLDTSGQPIRGAIAGLIDGFLSPPTDAEGRTVVDELSPSFEKIHVAAAGHRTTEILIQRGGDGEQTIRLEPANRLEVRVTGLPTDIQDLKLVLRGGPGLANPSFRSGLISQFNRTDLLAEGDDRDWVTIQLRADPDGVFRMQDVSAESSFDLELRGMQDQFLAVLQDQAMPATGTRSITMSFDGSRVQLVQVQVVDETGAAVENAELIAVGLPRGDYWFAFTDELGRMTYLKDRLKPHPGLRIEAEGFEPVELRQAEILPGDLRVVLKRKP